MSTPKICLNMIVKNESRIIERCIKSMYHLIDTWCIIDTGSTDGTQEIIKNILKDKPGELIERPWVNFGHNRNEALRFADKWGDWVLLTDADMILVDEGFNKSILDPKVDGYDIIQDNHGVRYYNTRILNTQRHWECIGVTHEYYSAKKGTNYRVRIPELWFDDVSDGGSKSDKFERDIKLLTQGLIDEPTNHRYMFYLAQSYRDTQQWDKAIEWYQKCAECSTWDEEAWFAHYMVGWCMCQKGEDIRKTESVLSSAWLRRPWRIEPIYMLAAEFQKKQCWAQAYALYKIAASTDFPHNDLLFISASLYEGQSVDQFAVAAYWNKKYEESILACNKLLERENFREHHGPRIYKNKWFAEKALGYYSPEKMEAYVKEKRKNVELLKNI